MVSGDLEACLATVQARESTENRFESVYRRYRLRAFYSAYALVRNREEAMELVHDAFLRAYQAWDRYDSKREFYPWFHRILRNLCLNWLRSRKRNPAKESLEEREGQVVAATFVGPDPLLAADQEERGRRIWEAIMALSEEDREIILLREFHGLAYKAIADSLGCPIGTVMSRLHTARKRLRAAVESRGISL